MTNSRIVVFWVVGVLLSLVFLAGCTIPTQILPAPVKPTLDSKNQSAATIITFDLVNWSSFNQLPLEIRNDTRRYAEKYSIPLVNWGFDPFNNEVDLYVKDLHDANATGDLQGKQIGNYTIHVFDDTELKKTEPEVRTFFTDLRKKPEYQIDNFTLINANFHLVPNTGRPSVLIYFNAPTPENQQIQYKYYRGWKVTPGIIYIGEEALNVSHAMNSD